MEAVGVSGSIANSYGSKRLPRRLGTTIHHLDWGLHARQAMKSCPQNLVATETLDQRVAKKRWLYRTFDGNDRLDNCREAG